MLRTVRRSEIQAQPIDRNGHMKDFLCGFFLHCLTHIVKKCTQCYVIALSTLRLILNSFGWYIGQSGTMCSKHNGFTDTDVLDLMRFHVIQLDTIPGLPQTNQTMMEATAWQYRGAIIEKKCVDFISGRLRYSHQGEYNLVAFLAT